MWKLIAACLALGGVSLLLPSEPSYDPLAWLIWGRELAHLHLDTSGGPSWKPLPVAFTMLVAPLDEVDHGLPPALWAGWSRRWRCSSRPTGSSSPRTGARRRWPWR